MNRLPMVGRISLSAGVLTACAVTIFAGAAAASTAAAAAAPPANASAEISPLPTNQLVYTGLDGSNQVTLSALADGRFRFTDTAPILAGAGCVIAKADPGLFAVICDAPKNSNGTLKSVRGNLGGGNDTFRTTSTVAVRIDGGIGNDVITGGPAADLLTDARGQDTLRGLGGSDTLLTDGLVDTLPDVLDGGPGDDDLFADAGNDRLLGGDGQDIMRGGLGADLFDGGTGVDTVTYLENGHSTQRLIVSIDNVANDGIFSVATTSSAEKDNVTSTVERVTGSGGNDTLIGNDGPNVLDGGNGNDILIGNKGADQLFGRAGDDDLASSQLIGANLGDGAIDFLDGGSEFDECKVPFPTATEADVTVSCEAIHH